METGTGENRLSLRLAMRPLLLAFRFDGRSTRTKVVAFFLLSAACNVFTIHAGRDMEPAFRFLSVAWQVGWTWPWLPLLVRRLHDQDRSPVWASVSVAQACVIVGVNFLPSSAIPTGVTVRAPFGAPRDIAWSWPSGGLIAAYAIASVAQLLFLLWRGTSGPNRYGADPRLDIETPMVTLPA